MKRLCVSIFIVVSAGWCFARSAAAESDLSAPSAATEELLRAEEEAAPPGGIYPSVVATINGKPLHGRDLELLVRRQLASIGSPEWKNLREEYKTQLTLSGLDSLISLELLYEAALAGGIKATDAEIRNELQQITGQFRNEAEFEEELARQGIVREALVRNIVRSITVAQFIDTTIRKTMTVTGEEMGNYYSRHPGQFRHPDIVRASHIYLFRGETGEKAEQARLLAEELLERIRKGEDFAGLAMKYSADASAASGGDLGFFSQGALDPILTEAAFSLPVGAAQIVETQFGYHVVKVTGRKEEGIATLDEVRQELEEFLKNEKVQERLGSLLDELRKKAAIEVSVP